MKRQAARGSPALPVVRVARRGANVRLAERAAIGFGAEALSFLGSHDRQNEGGQPIGASMALLCLWHERNHEDIDNCRCL